MNPETTEHHVNTLPPLKPGDTVIRYLAGTVRMPLTVESVTPALITCKGGWTFDPITGAEIDDDLNWGPPPKITGSFIVKEDA